MATNTIRPISSIRSIRVDRQHRLVSSSQGACWPGHERLEARCRRILRRCAESPSRGHACGIYALRSRDLAESLLRELPLPVAGTIALGRVSLWSRVIQNVDGWRAQFAYPYDVELVGGDPATARGLRRRYAVDVSLG